MRGLRPVMSAQMGDFDARGRFATEIQLYQGVGHRPSGMLRPFDLDGRCVTNRSLILRRPHKLQTAHLLETNSAVYVWVDALQRVENAFLCLRQALSM